MFKRLIIVLLALGLLFGGIFGWKYYRAQQAALQAGQPPPPVTVAAAAVQSESWESYLNAVGSLVAVQGIFVTNEVAGQVRAIHFRSGQPVQQGDLLLQLDDSVDRANLAGLIAERRLAELQFQRVARLLRDRSVSRADYDEAKAKLDNVRAKVVSQQASIAKKAVRAPFSGLLGIRQVDQGEYLAPGSPIVPLQVLDPIYVDYALPERYLAEIAVGQTTHVQVQAYPGRRFTGRITALNPGVDPGTRSLRIRAELNNPNGRLRPGMFAEVRTALPPRQNILTLPHTAITYNPYGATVFVIEEQSGALVVESRQVQTGAVQGGRVEIVSGLAAGQRVVSAGQVKLRNGAHVRIDTTISLDGEARSGRRGQREEQEGGREERGS